MGYLENLKAKGTDKEKDKQYELEASRASLQWEANLLETRSKLEQAKADLDALKSASPLSAQNISNQMDVVESYEKGLERLNALKAELFPAQ